MTVTAADDGRARFTPHTAFDDPRPPPDAAPRRSIETWYYVESREYSCVTQASATLNATNAPMIAIRKASSSPDMAYPPNRPARAAGLDPALAYHRSFSNAKGGTARSALI